MMFVIPRDLTSLFDSEAIPAFGFGMGDVTLRDFLETRKLLPPYLGAADLYLCRAGEVTLGQAEKIAAELRTGGVRVAVDLTDRKLGDQIKSADKGKIPYVAIVGEKEIAENKYTLRLLVDGSEEFLTIPEIISRLV